MEDATHYVGSYISSLKDAFHSQAQFGMHHEAQKYMIAIAVCSKLSRELPELNITATIENVKNAYMSKNGEVADQVVKYLEKREYPQVLRALKEIAVHQLKQKVLEFIYSQFGSGVQILEDNYLKVFQPFDDCTKYKGEHFKQLLGEIKKYDEFDKYLSPELSEQFEKDGKSRDKIKNDFAELLVKTYQEELPKIAELFDKCHFPLANKVIDYLKSSVNQLTKYCHQRALAAQVRRTEQIRRTKIEIIE